jgi:uncharacterized protein (TIGR01777 family)
MTIVLAGGSGFLGRPLRRHFTDAGHTVRTLTRHPATPGDVAWVPDGGAGPWAATLADTDVIVNLAGEGIADRRWTPNRKAALRTSRLLPARSIARALDDLPRRPRLVISGSAVGYYGARGAEAITEETGPGADFLARLCVDWEHEAAAAASPSTRVSIVRTGIVLHPEGGALKTMLRPFRLGVGGPLGNGRQFFPWIHREDWVALVAWLATSPSPSDPHGSLADPVAVWNATAPEPVTSADLSRTLGRVLRRPALLPAPYFALRLVLGEIAGSLTTGARVLPARAERAGFLFRFPRLEAALRHLLA